MKSKFMEFYKSIICEDTTTEQSVSTNDNITDETKKQEKPAEEKQEESKADDGIKTLEKDFLDKFIRYNELQMLMKDLPEIANSFKSIEGFDEQLIRDTVEKLLTDRQKEIDTLTTDLNKLRDEITKEAEVANFKKSVIDIFNGEAVKSNKNESPYGYVMRSEPTTNDNGEAYNNGETVAAKDGVPTVSVGMPEVIDDKMKPEDLPADNSTDPQVVDDLQQSVQKNADAIEVPPVDTKKKSNVPASKKDLVLIDSKKTKKSKKK